LLARVVEGGIEVKCRRCKRVVFVAFGVAALADERGPPTRGRNSG
jgi:phage FluMu protein Com